LSFLAGPDNFGRIVIIIDVLITICYFRISFGDNVSLSIIDDELEALSVRYLDVSFETIEVLIKFAKSFDHPWIF
jgi:hypothetical protein